MEEYGGRILTNSIHPEKIYVRMHVMTKCKCKGKVVPVLY
jgi:hypothetical protein